MIYTTRELTRTLQRMGDDFITVMIENREYVIDTVTRVPNHTDSPASHICLIARECGDGELKL